MADTSNIKGLEQGRAKFAYDSVLKVLVKYPKPQGSKEASKDAKKYKSYAKKLPMMIKTNGLGAALAFALSKGKADDNTPWGLLYKHIDTWLREHKSFLLGDNPSRELAEAVIARESSEYRAIAVEVLAFLNWLRRFAEGLIEGEAEED